jgi:phage N-6-adenine-methyltransferase
MFSNVNNAWCTPQDFFDKLNSEFNFSLDPCATEKSAKCAKFFTAIEDGLTKDWGGYSVFVNPPYGRQIGKWVKKCYEEGQKPNTTVVMLIPSRTDTRYFHDYIYGKAEIRFIKGRLTFWDLDGEKYMAKDFKSMTPAPFPSMVVIFKGGK